MINGIKCFSEVLENHCSGLVLINRTRNFVNKVNRCQEKNYGFSKNKLTTIELVISLNKLNYINRLYIAFSKHFKKFDNRETGYWVI